MATASVGFGFGPGVIGAGATAQARMNLSNNPAAVGVTVYRNGYTFNDIEDDDFHLNSSLAERAASGSPLPSTRPDPLGALCPEDGARAYPTPLTGATVRPGRDNRPAGR